MASTKGFKRLGILCAYQFFAYTQGISGQSLPAVGDSFEGNGTINTWYADQCTLQRPFTNPNPNAVNPSANVLRYHDQGGQYANVRFDIPGNFPLNIHSRFRLKIYIPSNGTTGNQTPRISLKLQNNGSATPWSTQCEIIQPLGLNQWQEVQFDFRRDPWINLNPNSGSPLNRNDFNRVVLQINGENNNDQVLAYLDDFVYDTLGYTNTSNTLVWSDEFEANGPIDTNKWFAQTLLPNGTSWYNNEIQHYTNQPRNAYVKDGTLNLVVRREQFTQQGITKAFTSARLNSKFSFRYGRIECRARIPMSAGTWPAIWMLGRNVQEPGAYWEQQGYASSGWPACGEIDIMEHWGSNPEFIHSSIHTPSSFGATIHTATRRIPGAGQQFQIYSLDWQPNRLTFSINGQTLYTYQPNPRNSSNWPFDAPQYLLFNVAMLNGSASQFQADSLQIDYIRIYQDSLDLQGPLQLRGQICYDNSTLDPMTNGKVMLRQNNRWLNDTALSNQGRFGFYGLLPGNYACTPVIRQSHGGLNASDALAVALHFAQVQPLQGLAILAADVNANGAINANDALNIALRYSGSINSFTAGDWVYHSTPVSLTNVGHPNLLIKVLATGDVNGSYRP